MTLNEFINHLKHNSIVLIIELIFNKNTSNSRKLCVGEFENWIYKNDYGKLEIEYIIPSENNTFRVLLNGGDN